MLAGAASPLHLGMRTRIASRGAPCRAARAPTVQAPRGASHRSASVVRRAAQPGLSGEPADWADDEECHVAFEVRRRPCQRGMLLHQLTDCLGGAARCAQESEAALRALCHGRAGPPASTHEYWRARGWRARPRDWECFVGTHWECHEAWPAHCVADDSGADAQAAAGCERARAAFLAARRAAHAGRGSGAGDNSSS
jgi:hypothetical protein